MATLATRMESATERFETSAVRTKDSVLGSCFRASVAIAVLLAVATGSGLLLDVYRDNRWVASQMRGQDLVSLAFGLPLLLVSAHLARTGSVRALLVWLGALGYITYSYLYIFGIAYNELFLVYLGLLVLSGSTLIRALVAIDPIPIWASFAKEAPTKLVARFLTGFGVALGALWGSQAVASLISGDLPSSVISSGHPTAVVFILDLALVVPLFLLGGQMLRRELPWGYVLGGLLLVKGISEGLALLGMSLFMFLSGHPEFDAGLVPLWALVTITSTYLSFRFFGAINPSKTTTPPGTS